MLNFLEGLGYFWGDILRLTLRPEGLLILFGDCLSFLRVGFSVLGALSHSI